MQEKTQEDRLRESAMTQGVDQQIVAQQVVPAVVEQVLGNLGTKSFHNFVGSPLEVWRQVSIATGPDVVPADKKLDTKILLRSFYVHIVPLPGPTPGEYKEAVRCVLIDVDNNAYAFVSDGVAGDLARLIASVGMGPYADGIPITVKAFTTKRGFRAYTIQPV